VILLEVRPKAAPDCVIGYLPAPDDRRVSMTYSTPTATVTIPMSRVLERPEPGLPFREHVP
jgi:hypothetical protein